jgi:hypothetical protein
MSLISAGTISLDSTFKDDIKINLQMDNQRPRYETKTQRMLISLSPCFSLLTNFINPWLLVRCNGLLFAYRPETAKLELVPTFPLERMSTVA